MLTKLDVGWPRLRQRPSNFWWLPIFSRWLYILSALKSPGRYASLYQEHCRRRKLLSDNPQSMSVSNQRGKAKQTCYKDTDDKVLILTLYNYKHLQTDSGWKPAVWPLIFTALNEVRTAEQRVRQSTLESSKSTWFHNNPDILKCFDLRAQKNLYRV